MKVGLQISSFTWPGGTDAIGPTLARICRDADEAGFDSIWVMDHFFQIRGVGRPEEPMLEGWTALGFMAAHTTRARLGLMVGANTFRNPGLTDLVEALTRIAEEEMGPCAPERASSSVTARARASARQAISVGTH